MSDKYTILKATLLECSVVEEPINPDCRIIEAPPDSDGVIRPRSVAEDPDGS